MANLKRFWLVLFLASLLFWPLYSDVVLTDEEAQVIMQTLEMYETELPRIQSELTIVSENLNLSNNELEQQKKLWNEQLKEAKKDSFKNILVWSLSALALGVVGGIVIGASIN